MTSDMAGDSNDGMRLGAGGPPELFFLVATTFDRFTGQMRRAIGINAHERVAIAVLWERGPMTMSELGGWIPLSRAAVTTLVDRLEADGLLERCADPDDRRRTLVRATAHAQHRMFPVVEQWSDDLRQLVVESADDWAAIERFLGRFREMTNSHAERLFALEDTAIQQMAPDRV